MGSRIGLFRNAKSLLVQDGDFRRLYPEYKDVADKVLSEKLYEKVGQPSSTFIRGKVSLRRPVLRSESTCGPGVGLVAAVGVFGVSVLLNYSDPREAK